MSHESNFKINLREVGCGNMDRIDLAPDGEEWRVLLSMVIKFRVPQNADEFLSRLATVSFSRTQVRGFN
jgi:hypothetical protein